MIRIAAVGVLGALPAFYTFVKVWREYENDKLPYRPQQVPVDAGFDTGEEIPGEAPRRLRKAETVLRRRTSELLVVLEASYDLRNQAAVLRTCDCLGIQHVWTTNPTMGMKGDTYPAAKRRVHTTRRAKAQAEKRSEAQEQMLQALDPGMHAAREPSSVAEQQNEISRKIARQSSEWLSLRKFDDTKSCIEALRNEGYTIWVTALEQGALSLDHRLEIPPAKLAVVFGREADGVSAEMIAAADKLVYFPLQGFSESLNLSVSAALILQRILDRQPKFHSAMSDVERGELRREWFLKLAKSPHQQKSYPAWAQSERTPRPFFDLRRSDTMRLGDQRIPPKIRARELGMRPTFSLS